MSQVNDIFSRCITQYLAQTGELPASLQQLLQLSTTRLLDSEMLIEDSFEPMAALSEPRVNQPLESFEQTIFIDQLTAEVEQNGFGDKFHTIIGLFGSIMIELTGSDEQKANVQQWVNDGIFGHFLMTDAGGPNLANWKTQLQPTDDGFTLSIDKKWGIEGQNLGFVMVVCQQQGKPFPLTVLVDPVKCKALEASACGGSYLDGKLQLGNVKGNIMVSKSDLMNKGGLGSVNRFLTLVRPRFVKCLMNHVLWLASQDRLTLNATDRDNIAFMKQAADWCISQTNFSIHSVDRVLSLKFASNEILLDLVTKGAVKDVADQRDLLGFTKMEGSSYRCLFEVYSKFKRGRR